LREPPHCFTAQRLEAPAHMATPGPYASRASNGWGSLVYRRGWTPGLLMNPHDGVVARLANESCFPPVVGSQVLVILHACRELDLLPDRPTVQETVKVDPFAAITRPRLATKRNAQASRKHLLLKCAQVFTDHLWLLPICPCCSHSGPSYQARQLDGQQRKPPVS